MKKLLFVVVGLLLLVAVLLFAKNIIAKVSVEKGVEMVTGLRLDMQSLDVGIIETLIGIEGLQLYNPEGYKDKVMVDIPEIYVDYDLGAFFKGEVHLEEVRLNLKEFVVVKNEKGELNLNALKVVKEEGKEEVVEEKTSVKEEKTKMPPLQIDVLELKIGKVIYKDYSKGTPPKVREFNININERYENITDPKTFASLILVKTLAGTTIARLANFDLGPLKTQVGETLKEATEITQETVGEAVEAVKEMDVEKVKETTGKAVDAGKEATEKVTETFKKILPFGK
ncbi:MAG: hypothetical protein KAS46_05515 [Candidatus Aureabacteria bacterium]|nr:hypothetical protein [Candidatus Auribacterota bacterium]